MVTQGSKLMSDADQRGFVSEGCRNLWPSFSEDRG